MNRDLVKLFPSINNSILTHTPIIMLPIPPSAKPVGCGIYLKTQKARYLISAGHLLNIQDWKDLIVPSGGTKVLNLNGVLATTFHKGNQSDDVDFSLFKFSPRMNKHFDDQQWKFITPEQIITNHILNDEGYYFIAGYPVSGVKKISGKAEFKPQPVKFITETVDQRVYDKFGFNKDNFILVKYKRKVAPFDSNLPQITKELSGISGSGLWYVPDFNDKDDNGVPKYYLVGIMTENHKDKGFLVAIKIDFITELMIQLFQDLSFEHTRFDITKKLKEIIIDHDL